MSGSEGCVSSSEGVCVFVEGAGSSACVGPDCPVKVRVNCVKTAFLPIAASGVGVHDRVPV